MMDLELLLQYGFALIAGGRPYRWSGDDPLKGFDCSGFATEMLKAAGIYPRTAPKMSAQQLYAYLLKFGTINQTGRGAFAFFGKSLNEIDHVGWCLDTYAMLHFGSGDSTTTTPERAAEQNAFGRMDPIRYRKDFLCVVRPEYKPSVKA